VSSCHNYSYDISFFINKVPVHGAIMTIHALE
jgi:hypothetical protein